MRAPGRPRQGSRRAQFLLRQHLEDDKEQVVRVVRRTTSNSELIFGSNSITSRQVIEMLSSPDMASRCRKLGIFRSYPVIGDEYCVMAREFVAAHGELMTRLLSGEAVEEEVIHVLIRNYLNYPSQVSAKTFFEITAARDRALNATMMRHLSALPPRDSINILGYGADSCADERRIAERLIRRGICKEATIFRYNPFSSLQHPDINDLQSTELEGMGGTKFDVILAFWTLHHVFPEYRWSEIGAFLRRVAPEGTVVILEEGDLQSPPSASPAERAYHFMVLCQDIIVNRALRPEWLGTPENFYAKYLSSQDMQLMEAYFARPFQRHDPSINRGGVIDETILFYDCP